MTQRTEHFPIVIVGTGFGGLGMAIRLKQEGIDDFVILERAGDVGGVWRDNTYPGCACDVESHLYSFSFAPDPRWTRMFAPQPEIWSYLRDVASRFGILPYVRFHHTLNEAAWDERAQHWRLETSKGTITAGVLVSGMGALAEPAVPKLAGLDTFKGKVFHSARWDHDYDLKGKRVAVIGTGASAIQFVPQIQKTVEKLHLFQRTPPWVLPRLDRAISARERGMFKKFPALQKAWRLRLYLLHEFWGITFRRPAFMGFGRKFALRHLARAVKDPALRAKLTPKYEIGCKRILLSNDYYRSLVKPNVEVVTDGIRELRAHSIVTETGEEREIDAVILGTGFLVTEMPFARHIRGRSGRTLSDEWQGSPKAYVGTTVAGYPNLFLLQGPNSGLGHTSVILMIEAQINHAVNAIRYMRRKGLAAVAPRADVQERFNAELDSRTVSTVWKAGGCVSWYLDRNGRNSTLWPTSVPAFVRRVEPFKPGEYELTAARTAREESHRGSAPVLSP